MNKDQKKFIRLIKTLKSLADNIEINGSGLTVTKKTLKLKFFYHRKMRRFILLKKSDTVCDLLDLEFPNELTRKLNRLIDSFINSKRIKSNGNRPYRIIKNRTKNQNQK